MAEDNKGIKKYKIYIKTQKTKDKIEIEVDDNTTIIEIKTLIANKTNAKSDEISLIFAGKILKDAENVATHHIQEGFTIHMVLRPSQRDQGSAGSSPSASVNPPTAPPAPAAPNTNPSSMPEMDPLGLGNLAANLASLNSLGNLGNLGNLPNLGSLSNLGNLTDMGQLRTQVESEIMNNPDMLRQLVNNPFIQSIMNDPENIRLFVTSNPQMRELIDRNPEINHLLNNPDLLRQTMELARNPAMLQELMRSHDRAISNLESIPGGYNALQRMYRDIQEPMLNAASEQNNPFAGLLGQQQPSAASADNPQQGTENRQPLPNPWSPTPPPSPRPATTNTTTATSGNTTQSVPTPGSLGPLGNLGNLGNFPSLASLGNLASMGNIASLDNPGTSGANLMQSLMQQMAENPELIQNLMGSPHMQTMMQTIANDPSIFNLLQPGAMGNPDQIRQAAQQMMANGQMQSLFQNPQALSEMLQLTRSLSNLHIPTTPENPTSTPMASSDNDSITPNPHIRVPLGTEEPPEQLYRAQLEQLESMGFVDQRANIRALMACFGDISAAVERLLSQHPS